MRTTDRDRTRRGPRRLLTLALSLVLAAGGAMATALPAAAGIPVVSSGLTQQPADPSTRHATSATGPVTMNYGTGTDARLDWVKIQDHAEPLRMAATNPEVHIRRVADRCTPPANEQSMWFGPYQHRGSVIDVGPSYVPTMAEVLADPYVNQGMDNIFTNYCGALTHTNIERVDLIVEGFTVRDQLADGFLLLERGANDPFKVQAITGVDAQGTPTSFGPVVYYAPSTGWGTIGYHVQPVVVQSNGTTEYVTNEQVPDQQVGGRFVNMEHLGIANGQVVHGIAIAGADAPDTTLADYASFPNNDPAQPNDMATGGLDLIASYLMTSRPRSIGDRVWLDADGDGVQDPGEAGVNGVQVELVDTWGNVIDTETTAGDGGYLFDEATPAEYTVRLVDCDRFGAAPCWKKQYTLTFDQDSGITNPDGSTVVPQGDDDYLLADFGLRLREPKLAVTKTVSGASGGGTPAIAIADDFLTYTVTITNTGNIEGEASFYDNLQDVLQHAVWFGVVKDGGMTATFDDTTQVLHIAGPIPEGGSATVTYRVKVAAPVPAAGESLINQVTTTPPTAPPTACDPTVQVCTETPIRAPKLAVWKTVTANTDPVKAGTELTYTVYFENSGEVDARVVYLDDLTHVLDDATLTSEPVATSGVEATRYGNRIIIIGKAGPNSTETVTYRVTVKPDAERGDDLAANFLMYYGDPGNPPVPPREPVCRPTDTQRPDCTATPIGRITTAKSVTASATPVTAGTVLTYTLTFENRGKAAAQVDHQDVLTRILDDAVLTSGPTSSDPALTLTPVTDRFGITGTLAAGQKATVSYQATVKDVAQRGDHSADNFLVPTGQTPPEECQPGDVNCTSTGIPLLQMTKTSDPATGTTVAAGQQVTYTLTFRNAGQGVGPVDYTDDLAAVLDDATLTTAPAASDPALTTTDGADGRVRITGELTGGQTATVTYTVTVKPDGERGDNRLKNVVAPTGTTDPECGVGPTVCTEHPVPELVTWKTSDPASGTTVRADGVITYTLHFENRGKADATVDHDDVLAAVLDDAEVTAAPTATGGLSVTAVADGRFHTSGTLAPGASATVSYQVKVLADGARGDDRNGQLPGPRRCHPARRVRARRR